MTTDIPTDPAVSRLKVESKRFALEAGSTLESAEVAVVLASYERPADF